MKDLTIEGGLRRSPIAPSLRCGAHTERRNPPSNNPHQKCYPCPRPCVTHVPGQNTARIPHRGEFGAISAKDSAMR
jgi:hypothetical protein